MKICRFRVFRDDKIFVTFNFSNGTKITKAQEDMLKHYLEFETKTNECPRCFLPTVDKIKSSIKEHESEFDNNFLDNLIGIKYEG